jgi:hypothetical protein
MPQARATAAINAILYQSHRCETGLTQKEGCPCVGSQPSKLSTMTICRFVSEATKASLFEKKRAVQRPEGQPDEGCVKHHHETRRFRDERPNQVCSKKAGCPTGAIT